MGRVAHLDLHLGLLLGHRDHCQPAFRKMKVDRKAAIRLLNLSIDWVIFWLSQTTFSTFWAVAPARRRPPEPPKATVYARWSSTKLKIIKALL